MGFGYKQARAAGLRGIRQSRSPKQVNRITGKAKLDRFMVNLVLERGGNDPEWKFFVAHWLSEGLDITEVLMGLHWAKKYADYRQRGEQYYYNWLLD